VGELNSNSNQLVTNVDPVLLKAIINRLSESNLAIDGYSQIIEDSASPKIKQISRKLSLAASRQLKYLEQARMLLRLLEGMSNIDCRGLDLLSVIPEDNYSLKRHYRLPEVVAPAELVRTIFELIANFSDTRQLDLNFRCRNGFLVIRFSGLKSWLKKLNDQSNLRYSDSLEQICYYFLKQSALGCGGQLHIASQPKRLYLRLRISTQLAIDIQ
jgi:hypothetical protein